MIQIKDVIHYYINSEALYRKWYVDDPPETIPIWSKLTTKRFQLLNDFSIVKVEYALRRLEDMTEAEALHIGKLAMFDQGMHYPDKDYKVWKPEGVTIDKSPSCYAVEINNDWFENEIRIGFRTGNVWAVKGDRIQNQTTIFHYLLKQGFDLFGLCESNQAIDAKTLNQKV